MWCKSHHRAGSGLVPEKAGRAMQSAQVTTSAARALMYSRRLGTTSSAHFCRGRKPCPPAAAKPREAPGSFTLAA